MDKEFYIIKREAWDYGNNIPEYLDTQGGFTRDLKKIKTFTNIEDASEIRFKFCFKDGQLVDDYMYSIVAM